MYVWIHVCIYACMCVCMYTCDSRQYCKVLEQSLTSRVTDDTHTYTETHVIHTLLEDIATYIRYRLESPIHTSNQYSTSIHTYIDVCVVQGLIHTYTNAIHYDFRLVSHIQIVQYSVAQCLIHRYTNAIHCSHSVYKQRCCYLQSRPNYIHTACACHAGRQSTLVSRHQRINTAYGGLKLLLRESVV